MADPGSTTPPTETPAEDRLNSWKEIAAYLHRDVTTVQRWEKREGMPVHRHLHDRMGSVYAYRTDLDAWMRSRNLRGEQENGNNGDDAAVAIAPAPPPQAAKPGFLAKWPFVLPLAAIVATMAIGAIIWL